MRSASLIILSLALALLAVTAYDLCAEGVHVESLASHHPGSYYFTDCSSGSPHDDDIGYLYESGIVQGVGGGAYAPDMPVTRQQMASYLARTEAVVYTLTFMSVDWNFFGGYYTGPIAYNEGRITWDQYQAAETALLWATDAARAEFDRMSDTEIEQIFRIYF
jgi:hypothetical protein